MDNIKSTKTKKKVLYFVARQLSTPPPPLQLIGHIFFSSFKKYSFYLVARPLPPSPKALVAGPLKKDLFLRLP